MSEAEQSLLNEFPHYRQRFIAAMDDDLNTADGISAIFEFITAVNTAARDGASGAFAEKSLALLAELTRVLGLLPDEEEGEEIDEELAALIEERQAARKNKNFARADEIRDLLKARGITLQDTPQGIQVLRTS